MRAYLWPGIGLLVILVGTYFLTNYNYNKEYRPMSVETPVHGEVQILPIEHATAVIRWGDSNIYTDPVGGAEAFAGQSPANIVLVTDIHSDHFSTSTLSAVVSTSTTLITPQAVADQLPSPLKGRAVILNNGERTEQ